MNYLTKMKITLVTLIASVSSFGVEITTLLNGEIYEPSSKEIITYIVEGTAVDTADQGDSSVGKCKLLINNTEEYYFAISPVRLGEAAQWTLAGTYYAGLTPAVEDGYTINIVPQRFNEATHSFVDMDITDLKITVMAWESNATLTEQINDLRDELKKYSDDQDELLRQAITVRIIELETQLSDLEKRVSDLEKNGVGGSSDSDDDEKSWGELAVLPAVGFLGAVAIDHANDKSAAKRLVNHEKAYHRKDTDGKRPPRIQTPKPKK